MSKNRTIGNSKSYKTNHKFFKETIHEMRFDFMGPIKPVEIYTGNKYIFLAIDYVTKWVKQEHRKLIL
jgi:hypothetical protein